MSGMILCRSREADTPLYLSDTGVKIYSLEELCYYIYNNIYIIGTEFINDGLLEFIEFETKEKPLADMLSQMMKRHAGLAEMVVAILKYVDYYSISEIEAIKGILNTLGTKNVFERLKLRADRFLENKCYYSAIKNYLMITKEKRDPSLSGIFYAKVYHNAGVAYASMFLYSQAYPFFEEAYRLGQHEESKRCAIAAKRLSFGDNYIENEDATEDEYVVKCEIETLMDNAGYSDDYRKIDEIEKIKNDGNIAEYHLKISEMLQTWKEQYIKYTS